MGTHEAQAPAIILLNGASSAGKTTLGRALHRRLELPYLFFSSDQLVESETLPAVDRGARQGPWAWTTLRPNFFEGFHRCVPALAEAGNRLIVEHVVERRDWFELLVQLLAPYDVFYVGVHCPLLELERRERERGNRQIGEGRSHLEDEVHSFGNYDFEIDTSQGSPEGNADLLMEAMRRRRSPSAFRRALRQPESSPPSSTGSRPNSVTVRMLGAGEHDLLARAGEGVFDGAVRTDVARAFLSDERHHIAVALIGEQLVGFATGIHYFHPDKPQCELFVNEVGVVVAYRRQGLGRRLVRALLRHGRTLGCTEAWVLTEPHNHPAMGLYARLGGVESATRLFELDPL